MKKIDLKETLQNDRYAVIIAGGRGERFWPRSRLGRPKHLLNLLGRLTLLEETLERLKDLIPQENIFIITNQAQEKAVREKCPHLTLDQVIAEPLGRDTTAAICLAMTLVSRRNPKGVFAVLPADAAVADCPQYQSALNKAFQFAWEDSSLVTIGIKPTYAATGYGYLKRGEPFAKGVYGVEEFVEKPNLSRAKEYFDHGEYYWNAGMFVWQVPVLQAALKTHCPEFHVCFSELETALSAGEKLEVVLSQIYPNLEKISIDYALMEKAKNVSVVEGDFGWDDVGSWTVAAQFLPKDTHGNAFQGSVVTEEAKDNIIISEDGHMTAVLGVQDMIIIHTKDATLVCPKDRAEDIKKLVQKMDKDPRYQRFIQ